MYEFCSSLGHNFCLFLVSPEEDDEESDEASNEESDIVEEAHTQGAQA